MNNINLNDNKNIKEQNGLNNKKKLKYNRNKDNNKISKLKHKNFDSNLMISPKNSYILLLNNSNKEKYNQGILLTKNNISDYNKINSENIFADSELNTLSYEEAIINDI